MGNMNWCYKEYDCGCEIVTDNMGAYEIDYCPKHKSAPDLYEALKKMLPLVSGYYLQEVIDAEQALAKAEEG
ncbi:hypothetical protein LCGC14_1016020 [marine sediment metagenome]|uniref:Uncharacterized protein n=1 Tax=marine sediment metagenome TaxID=412755 RepID=A0A0F9R4U9_9ZZZZ